MKSAYDKLPKFPVGVRARMLTTREEFGTANGRKTSPSAMLKIAELAPMASAIETIAVAAKPGFCRSVRIAKRMSFSIDSFTPATTCYGTQLTIREGLRYQ